MVRAPALSGLFATLVVAMAMGGGSAAMAQAPAPVIYTIEQLSTGPLSAEIQQQIGPLHTLSAVEDLLKLHQVTFAWRVTDVGSDTLSPQIASQIAALPPQEVFVIPSPTGVLIGVIVARR